MAEALPLGSELGLLGGIRLRGLDLLELVAEDVEVALPSALALADRLQLPLQPDHLGVGVAVAAAAIEVLLPGEAVEGLELGAGEGQLAVLVLAVEGEQAAADRLQLRRRGHPALDEGAGAPGGRDPAPENELLGVLRQPRGDLGQLGVVEHPLGQLEHPLDVGLLGARPDDLRPRLAAHDQVERVGEDRLPGSGLAGDRVQPRAEAELGALDQQQVLDPKLKQHRPPVLTTAADGFTPYCARRPNFSRIRW